uniref:D-alanine--D-alanine ligase n=1 Tax=Candidatus Kentrum sp. SD TaxID=2126332 RepID=A0A451BM11_9GAMM|nr:MAG: D-alanine-D-alanine ligase [Candidatus Kentron sp. SD]VFK44315.1 MAG: D-alanine-D-alanine ligase [Candidatus Kentron sp. SD]VFK79303.1 MAG: D-alanine-D-alanine ligase [Candidatus Kentron sp. SD]
MDQQKRVAVFFGGRSPEHDVSIITGLQALTAIASIHYDPFPVYIDLAGRWWIGEALRERSTYLPDAITRKNLARVMLDSTPGAGGALHPWKSGFFRKARPVHFDIALLALHGLSGENGDLQGAFEVAHVPYTGMRVLASSLLMDKVLTKEMLRDKDIPLLPYTVIEKPSQGLLPEPDELERICGNLAFPCCIKPRHLGSSIGVAKVDSLDELNAVLPNIFRYDTFAIVEPFVNHLTEYNISVRRNGQSIAVSAIEQPKHSDDLLDFKQKYRAGMDGKTGKIQGTVNEGMLSATRTINPELEAKTKQNLIRWARIAFETVGGTGAPRIDFLCDEQMEEIWLNEVNPCPGSFGYFLWEAASEPLLFTELLTHLLEEAEILQARHQLPYDPVPEDARLFRRSTNSS